MEDSTERVAKPARSRMFETDDNRLMALFIVGVIAAVLIGLMIARERMHEDSEHRQEVKVRTLAVCQSVEDPIARSECARKAVE